jgi:hypothetical protein
MVMKIRATLEIPDRSITRTKLEYPTEDVSLAYLVSIDKATHAPINLQGTDDYVTIVTVDSFTDKAIRSNLRNIYSLIARANYDVANRRFSMYAIDWWTGYSSQDHYLRRFNSATNGYTTLAVEAVDLSDLPYLFTLSTNGSTIKSIRETAILSATDTVLASGVFGLYHLNAGINLYFNARLLAPLTPLPPAQAIIEVEVEGDGTPENPYGPLLSRNLVEIAQLEGLPSFLYQEARKYEILKAKGFTDEEMKLLLGSIPQHQVDLNSITWGAFEFKEDSPTNIIIMTGDNPYQQGAISKHVELARSKNLKTLRPPRNYGEAVAQFNQIKRDFSHWIVGKDNYAYHTLGWEELDLFQNVDFYHGELIEHKTHYDQLKRMKDFEMWRRLEELERRLEKIEVLTDERDKHIAKLKDVKRLGW